MNSKSFFYKSWTKFQDARNGKTALHLAAENGCREIVELLTVYGDISGQRSYNGVMPSGITQESRSGSGDLLEHYYTQSN